MDRRHCTGSHTEEKGSILVSTLLILVVLNLLAIGLLQTSSRESKMAGFKTIDSAVLHAADSCVMDTVNWLGAMSSPPAVLPNVISYASLDHMYTGDETQEELNKLSGYSYDCTTTALAVKSVSGQSLGIGTEIGENSAYGSAGDLSPRYYYEVVSSAQGPQNSSNRILATVSAEY
ncbi:MAG: hypothetical protein GC136_03435 [Alphaproteobacteria bacterium]|nr:hypothetical protein [Alphaproteobacteria bacterium]